jgi:hypothetical protein
MRPLTVVIGIIMGSAVSLAVGLALTWVVLLFMDHLGGELLRGAEIAALAARGPRLDAGNAEPRRLGLLASIG